MNKHRIAYRGLVLTTLIASLLLLIQSCGGGKSIVQATGEANLSKKQFLKLQSQQVAPPEVDGSGKATIIAYGKQDINLGGIDVRWSLEREKTFVLSARAMGIMEVGRLTIDKRELLLLDRMGRHAFKVDNLAEQTLFLENVVGINTDILKAFVQHEPFGLQSMGRESLQRMRFKRTQKQYIFTDQLRKGGHKVEHTFDAAMNLIQSRLELPSHATVVMTYDHFVLLDGTQTYRPVPTKMRLDIDINSIPSQHIHLQIDLNKAKSGFSQKVSTAIPRGYEQVTLIDLIRMLE